jgi:hypothetical protein
VKYEGYISQLSKKVCLNVDENRKGTISIEKKVIWIGEAIKGERKDG